MQKKFANYLGISALFALAVLFVGCDLPVQPKFEFNSEVGELPTFEDQTVLEWMRSEAAISAEPNNNFDTLVAAIELTGLEEEYNTPGAGRTFLMLRNRAFTDRGEIYRVLRVSSLSELSEEGIERLRTILRYHIIDSYVDQSGDALPTLFDYYTFQTLIPGEDGIIALNRDERFRMNINRADNLPSTRRGTRVQNHNYIFSNGVGHHINDYVRIRPF